MPIFLKNATYIDYKSLEFKSGNIRVEEGAGGGIGFVDNIPKDAEILDCSGKYVTRSFVNAHHHIYSALACGMPAPKKSPSDFAEILKYVWWVLDKSLDLDIIRASARVTAIECAKNGVTFVIDHHASPFAVEGSLSVIAEEFDRAGVGYILCYELSDRDGDNIAESGLAETENYLKSGRNALVGLHASFTVSDSLMGKAVGLAKKYDSGIHIHTAEDPIDQSETLKLSLKRVTERFKDAGVLGLKKSILVHCLHLNEYERTLIKNSGVWVAENADSNLNNNVGFFDSRGLGDNIMLGTDGMYSDMLRSAKSAFLIGQTVESPNPDNIYARLRNAHRYIAQGGFKGDGENNLVILDYQPRTEMNSDNFLGHLIFAIESRDIESVISGGKVIVKNRRTVNIDEKDAYRFSREMSEYLWKQMEKYK
jgi:cytosine/adenosine deaminase-related metal-dependent hydrolase